MTDLEGKLREQFESLFRKKFPTGTCMLNKDDFGAYIDPQTYEDFDFFCTAVALGRAEGLSDALKIIREYTYLDGRAGEMANLLEDRIRALKEKV